MANGRRLKYHEQDSLFSPTEVVPVRSTWSPPVRFPDLSSAKVISLDVESKDEFLREKGPGYARGDAYIVGLAIGTDDGFRGYYPIRHKLGGNLDPKVVLRWAKDQLTRPGQLKVGANLIYDLEALAHEGIKVQGPFWDVQIADPLINENEFSYSLDDIARRRIKEHKTKEDLYKWSAAAYGGNATAKGQGGRIWMCPTQLVGPYAEGDVDLPLKIMEVQRRLISEQGLGTVFDIESRLLPLLLEMRLGGVKINVPKVEKAIIDWSIKLKKVLSVIRAEVGFDVEIWAEDSVAKAFRKVHITDFPIVKGKPSFTVPWLEAHSSRLAHLIREARQIDKFINTFLRGSILDVLVKDRIYTQFNQLKGDDTGTISGRFSSCNPNLQFIPARDKVIGPLIRSMFIPENEDEDWVKDDYSQVEFRILTHYGSGPSAEEARARYIDDPLTDFHDMVADMCCIERKPAKTINFGLAYNMGLDKLAYQLGRPVAEVKPIYEQYHQRLGFVKKLQEDVTARAKKMGYIRTILGRRARFDMWESSDWDASKADGCMTIDKAKALYGNKIRRARCHTAMNRLIQGSAADINKVAMVKIFEAGICDVIGPPKLTVHDELDWSRSRSKQAIEAHKESLHIMETAVKLSLPLNCDSEKGPSWGEVKHYVD